MPLASNGSAAIQGLDKLDQRVTRSWGGYEERSLLTVLDALALDADPHDVLGPL